MYNVVVIGAGNIGCKYDDLKNEKILTHCHAINNNSNFSLLGIRDIDRDEAIKEAKKWNTVAIDNISELEKDIEIVCCAVPDDFHYSVMMEIINDLSPKAVICEKPISKKVEEAREIVEIYRKKNIPLFVNYSRRYIQEFYDLKQWIRKAGDIISGICLYGKGVFHNCSHMLNLFDYLLEDIEVIKVGRVVYDYFDDDPSVEFQLKSKNGNIYFSPVPCDLVTVFEFDLLFSNGRIKYSDTTNTIEYYKIDESAIYGGELNYILEKNIKISSSNAMKNLYKNIYEVLEKRREVLCDGNSAYKTIELCEQIREMAIKNEKEKGSCNN